MTNAELIRNMTDEKMASTISEMILGALAGITTNKDTLATLTAGVLEILK